MDLLDIPSMDMLQRSHRGWVEESLRVERSARDSKWSESIAVGSKGFVATVKKQLGLRAKGRKITESAGRVPTPGDTVSLQRHFRGRKWPFKLSKLYFWEVYPVNRMDSVARPRTLTTPHADPQ